MSPSTPMHTYSKTKSVWRYGNQAIVASPFVETWSRPRKGMAMLVACGELGYITLGQGIEQTFQSSLPGAAAKAAAGVLPRWTSNFGIRGKQLCRKLYRDVSLQTHRRLGSAEPVDKAWALAVDTSSCRPLHETLALCRSLRTLDSDKRHEHVAHVCSELAAFERGAGAEKLVTLKQALLALGPLLDMAVPVPSPYQADMFWLPSLPDVPATHALKELSQSRSSKISAVDSTWHALNDTVVEGL
eukprot:2501537-Amphidinium_carterae.3